MTDKDILDELRYLQQDFTTLYRDLEVASDTLARARAFLSSRQYDVEHLINKINCDDGGFDDFVQHL